MVEPGREAHMLDIAELAEERSDLLGVGAGSESSNEKLRKGERWQRNTSHLQRGARTGQGQLFPQGRHPGQRGAHVHHVRVHVLGWFCSSISFGPDERVANRSERQTERRNRTINTIRTKIHDREHRKEVRRG
jgi:hypothetical protein